MWRNATTKQASDVIEETIRIYARYLELGDDVGYMNFEEYLHDFNEWSPKDSVKCERVWHTIVGERVFVQFTVEIADECGLCELSVWGYIDDHTQRPVIETIIDEFDTVRTVIYETDFSANPNIDESVPEPQRYMIGIPKNPNK